MSDANRKSKLTMLLMASLITTNFAFADNAYKNNVVDVKVNKEANNAVMVTIYTDKPYTEPVVVNKKANNKYVILMPETKSSLKSAPSVANMSGTVSNVSVNTQAVSGSKGYTKIVITSEKAITVVPRMQQLSTSSTQPASAAAVQKAQQEARAKAAAQKAAADKAKKDAEAKKLAEQKAQQEAQAKKTAAVKAQKNAEAKRQAQQKAQQAAKEKQLAVQKAAQQTALPQTQKTKQPIEILEQEIKTDKNAKFMQSTNDPVLNREIQENAEKNRLKNAKKKKTTLHETNNNRQSVMDNIKAVLRDYKNVSLWKLLLLAGAITFPVIVIIII
ncbi:MAG: hypothetical protein LUB59_02480, partial [Candidatus Gastranaerophilales bacterium]|nr:hypothetical protein [Candidatus Gastranaerophilales bacterium]